MLSGCGNGTKLKRFDSDGISLMLPEEAAEQHIEGHFTTFTVDGCLAVVDRYTFEEFEQVGIDAETLPQDEYNAIIESANKVDGGFTDNANGDPYVTYSNMVGDTEYFYYSTTRKGSDSFWFVTFACKMEEKDLYAEQFDEWNKGIEVK